MRWIAAHRRALAMMLLASLAGLGAGLALASSGTKTRAATVTISIVRTKTLVQTHVLTGPGRVVTRTITTPAPAGPPAAARPPAAQPPRAATVMQHFAGRGAGQLGTITVASPAILRWTSTGTRFRLLFNGDAQAISSSSHAGQTFVPAQTYHQVRVQTDGNWTIRIG